MALIKHHILVSEIPDMAAPLRLIGDQGGHSAITGEVCGSNVVMGALAIETEHGTVYLDPESEIEVQEDDAKTLDDRVEGLQDDLTHLITDQLNERLGWYAHSDDRSQAVGDIARSLVEQIDTLLAEFPADSTDGEDDGTDSEPVDQEG